MIYINTKNLIKTLINKSIYIVLYLGIFSLFSFLFSLPVLATSNTFQEDQLPIQYLKISPIISDIVLTPGKATIIPLTIQNLSDKPLGIHAETSGFDETADSSLSQVPTPLADWTSLSDQDIIIDSKETKTINVVINPPTGTKTGGFYEAIFLTPFISQKKMPDRPVVLSRIGALVFATVGKLNYEDLAKKVTLIDFKPNSIINPSGVSFSVKNSYFTHFTAKPFLTIHPLFGKPTQMLLDEKHVLPGKEKTWQIKSTTKSWGFYNANLAVSVGNGNQIKTESWFLILPDLKIIGAILLLITIFAIYKTKRFKKAVIALFK